MKKTKYDRNFFERQKKDAEVSFLGIIKCLNRHLGGAEISSAIDLGCGLGYFLNTYKKVWQGEGKKLKVHGVDGDYVQRDMLALNKDEFEAYDLKKVYRTDATYDIAISTECAEHLPPQRADSFVEDLTRLSDIVLFSAAVPYQGGTEHINEQPVTYWIKLFDKYGYEFRDIIRPDIWDDSSIATCYRQNMVIYVRRGSRAYDMIDKEADKKLIDVIHPDHWKYTRMLFQGRLGRIYMYVERILIRMREKMK